MEKKPMHPFKVFVEEHFTDDTVIPLPSELERVWGGSFRIVAPQKDRTRVLANFVKTTDGRISYAEVGRAEGRHISESNLHDRFTMALVRTISGATFTGANTLRAESSHLWTPEYICSEYADAFKELRTSLHLPNVYTTIFLTRSGSIVSEAKVYKQPQSKSRVIIITTPEGATQVDPKVREYAQVEVMTSAHFEKEMLSLLLTRYGITTALCEGPAVFGSLLAKKLVDELFLTVSPKLIGGNKGKRPGLLEGTAFSFEDSPHLSIASERALGEYRYFRYRFT